MKVFHIGYQKTGTSTYEQVYKTLGYNLFDRLAVGTKHYNLLQRYKESLDFDLLLPIIEDHTAFADNPWFWRIHDKLHATCPDAKFVLTTRDSDKWFDSLKAGHMRMDPRVRWALYNGFKPSEENRRLYKSIFDNYNNDVRSYFEDRHNFIEINIDESPDWQTICDFLDKTVPNKPFPWLNKRKSK